jgi:murein DD-endopeptidase MepM/ murein hydrolase activator NlpD
MVNTPSSPEQPLTRRQRKELDNARGGIPTATVIEAVEKKPAPRPPVEPKPSLGKRILSWGTMIATPLLFIGVSLPVNIFYDEADMTPAIAGALGEGDVVTAQSFTVAGSQSTQVGIQRQSWSVTSFAEVLKARYGSRSFSYSTTGTGSIRWPFPTAVPISSGFGDRVAPCRYCSSNHRGVDFIPGNGAPIFAIAQGVVTASEFGGGYGQYAYLEHEINGRSVMTVYAHMQRGSSPLRVGDVVNVGDFIGLVGNTGTSTGPHLHFEVRIEGEYVDPFAWLKENAF